MKNHATIPASLALFALVTLSAPLHSCRSAASIPPEFSVIERSERFATPGGDFDLDYRFEYLSGYSDAAVRDKIQASMASGFFGAEWARADAVLSAAAFDEGMGQNYGARTDAEFRWDGFLKILSTAELFGGRIVAFRVERTEYTGGAHGMRTVFHANYDLASGERLTLDDLFTPEGRAALAGAIREQIVRDKGAASWEDLVSGECYNAAEEIAPTENFSLTRTAITFEYNPYDIACWATGATTVTLPTANLAGFKKDMLSR
jgi:hypothetical protein